MTHYIKDGNNLQVAPANALNIQDHLPVGTYTVKHNPMTGQYYLTQIGDFELPAKLYGNAEMLSDRLLNTFDARPAGTGVLLSGEKGSGKTMTSKLTSQKARKRGYPTLVINDPLYGETFNQFIQSIDTPCVIIFDEFEKVYGPEEQQALLTLLDGVYSSKKLFILTTNDRMRIDRHMRNRPGRIYYRIDYKGLEDAFIREYCTDNLIDTSQIDAICRYAVFFGDEFNFDILAAIVEEMNRYGEDVQTVVNLLNARPEYTASVSYDVTIHVPNPEGGFFERKTEWHGAPFVQSVARFIDSPFTDAELKAFTSAFGDTDEDNDIYFEFGPNEIVAMDAATGKITYRTKNGEGTVTLTKQMVTPVYNTWMDL